MRQPKDFTEGELAYAVSLRGRCFSIIPTVVKRVGRKYVYTQSGYDYEPCHGNENYLIEHIQMSLLFVTEREAMEYLERIQLERWLSNVFSNRNQRFSLDQLRKVKEILSDEK